MNLKKFMYITNEFWFVMNENIFFSIHLMLLKYLQKYAKAKHIVATNMWL